MDGEYIEMCLQAAKTTTDVRFGVKHERAMVELGDMREELYLLRNLVKQISAVDGVLLLARDGEFQIWSNSGLSIRYRPTQRAADVGTEWACSKCGTTNMLDVPICQACFHPRG